MLCLHRVALAALMALCAGVRSVGAGRRDADTWRSPARPSAASRRRSRRWSAAGSSRRKATRTCCSSTAGCGSAASPPAASPTRRASSTARGTKNSSRASRRSRTIPIAVYKGLDNFENGEISVRFQMVGGTLDRCAGILFNVKPNGDYLTVRYNGTEDNVVLWTFNNGVRKFVKRAPTLDAARARHVAHAQDQRSRHVAQVVARRQVDARLHAAGAGVGEDRRVVEDGQHDRVRRLHRDAGGQMTPRMRNAGRRRASRCSRWPPLPPRRSRRKARRRVVRMEAERRVGQTTGRVVRRLEARLEGRHAAHRAARRRGI